MVSSLDNIPLWVIALAGSTGSMVSNLCVYPLDVVKTRLQVQCNSRTRGAAAGKPRRHYKGTLHALVCIVNDEEGSALYNGVVGNSIGVVSTNFAYFYCYQTLQTMYLARCSLRSPPSTPIVVELSLGTAAGVLAQICTTPISVVTTRQQADSVTKRGMIQTAQSIFRGPDGYLGLWKGMKTNVLLSVNPAITYTAYHKLRGVLFPSRVRLKPHEAFSKCRGCLESVAKLTNANCLIVLGALSKMLATIITQPLIVAKTTLQSGVRSNDEGKKPFNSFQQVLSYIVWHEGFSGLYKGLVPQLLKSVLLQGIMMMVKERVELLFILLFRHFRVKLSSSSSSP